MTEGRKNQLREMFFRIEHPVIKLKRVAMGPVRLGKMRIGGEEADDPLRATLAGLELAATWREAGAPIAVGVVASDKQGRVVLVRRGENPGKGLWGLPAGFMEIDETTEETARRECLEETGLQVELKELWGVWSFFHAYKQTSGVLILYRAIITGGEATAGSDSVEVRTVTK